MVLNVVAFISFVNGFIPSLYRIIKECNPFFSCLILTFTESWSVGEGTSETFSPIPTKEISFRICLTKGDPTSESFPLEIHCLLKQPEPL